MHSRPTAGPFIPYPRPKIFFPHDVFLFSTTRYIYFFFWVTPPIICCPFFCSPTPMGSPFFFSSTNASFLPPQPYAVYIKNHTMIFFWVPLASSCTSHPTGYGNHKLEDVIHDDFWVVFPPFFFLFPLTHARFKQRLLRKRGWRVV